MPTDPAGLTDSVILEMNGEEVPTNNFKPLVRPADGASTAKWVDYCVSLGADRDWLLGKTEHYVGDANAPPNPETPQFAVSEKATKTFLKKLASDLGG